MILKDLYDYVYKEKRKIKRVKVVKKFAVGIGVVVAVVGILCTTKRSKRRRNMDIDDLNTVEKIKHTVETETEVIKESVANVKKGVSNAIIEAQATTENVKEDIKDGLHITKRDIHQTVKKVVKELDNL